MELIWPSLPSLPPAGSLTESRQRAHLSRPNIVTFLVALFVGESRQKCSLKLVRQRKAADHRRVAPASQRAVLAAADVVFRQFDWRNVLSHRERRLSSAHGHVAVVQLNVFGVNRAAVDEMSRALRFFSQIIRSSQHRHSADVEPVDAMSCLVIKLKLNQIKIRSRCEYRRHLP